MNKNLNTLLQGKNVHKNAPFIRDTIRSELRGSRIYARQRLKARDLSGDTSTVFKWN
jgi:hypothetical protein